MGARLRVYDNPLNVDGVRFYANALRGLLSMLDWEIIETALVGDREADLLGTERQVIDRIREVLQHGVGTGSVFGDDRRRGLAVLDAFESNVLPGFHDSSSRLGAPGATGVSGPTVEDASDAAPSRSASEATPTDGGDAA